MHLVRQNPATEVSVGDTVTVSITAENPTALAATTTAILAVDGTEVDAAEVQVGANSEKTIGGEAACEDAGEYTLSVNGTPIGDPLVVAERETETATETGTPRESASALIENDTPEITFGQGEETTAAEGPGFGVFQGIAALAGIACLLDKLR